ncbi:sugar nucleotide-binding protein [Halonotius sp. GCM10025705]|uniref:sugar nucleotide-binding protein n=1 Tax=Halonotius sp. GCM10025705 TaxID=3252678 RepID=UPI00361B729D
MGAKKLGSQTTPVEVFKDWSNNPIHNSDVANCIRLLLEDEHRGIYHVVGPEFINRYSWARQIAAVFGYDPNRISPSESGDALPADRPNASLSTKKITSTLNYCPVGIHDGLYRMISERQYKCEFSSSQS